MKKNLFHIIFSLIAITGFGQELDIGIMRDYTLGTIEISHNEGNYEIYGDTTLITNIWAGQKILFKRSGEKIKVIKADKTIGFYDSLTVKEMSENSSVKIQCLAPTTKKKRRYKNDFVLTPERQQRYLGN